MLSLHSPFSFSPPISHRSFSPTVMAGAAGIASAVIFHRRQWNPSINPLEPSRRSRPLWSSISSNLVESDLGVSFPPSISDSLQLLGIGLRKKSIIGLKNIDIYSFGVYANKEEIKQSLRGRNVESSSLMEALIKTDLCLTIRLQVIYGRLTAGSVRSAFEESVGRRLQKFGGSLDKDLLQRFTSQFRDEYKIPKGSVIDIKREPGYVLRTSIDGKEVGGIESEVLCKSILDLYIGDDPFDQRAKEAIELKVANLIN